jgi:hypothetical protein
MATEVHADLCHKGNYENMPPPAPAWEGQGEDRWQPSAGSRVVHLRVRVQRDQHVPLRGRAPHRPHDGRHLHMSLSPDAAMTAPSLDAGNEGDADDGWLRLGEAVKDVCWKATPYGETNVAFRNIPTQGDNHE